MQYIKKILKFVFIISVVLVGSLSSVVYAEGFDINFSLINDGVIVFSSIFPLPAEGVVSVSDSSGSAQEVNARSVLNMVKNADESSSDFNISNLIYYSSFGAFYLKCINVNTVGELCDDWMYKVNGESPESGMDGNILFGGEDVVLIFGNDEPEVVEEDPEVIPEVEPVTEEHTRSNNSGSYSSNSQTIIQVSEVVPIVVSEVKTEIKVEEPPKPLPAKIIKMKKNSKPVVQNTASVIQAVDIQPAPVLEKKSWYQRFLNWLFGF